MLVLTCKTGESIKIDDRITVRVVAGKKGQLRLAIDAPKDVAIHRGEKQPS
ncbi:carbon storage regulator [Gracilibacillus sp. YIM 98692]|uniref:carbon storage regulator n=1 Tax=Gracilibacillus sp. YIM 98692 TaxID=2663532 RepID=UPI0013D4BE88|nr:carbon storage regulator [Gracilibacillus sp. YIM 98692]